MPLFALLAALSTIASPPAWAESINWDNIGEGIYIDVKKSIQSPVVQPPVDPAKCSPPVTGQRPADGGGQKPTPTPVPAPAVKVAPAGAIFPTARKSDKFGLTRSGGVSCYGRQLNGNGDKNPGGLVCTGYDDLHPRSENFLKDNYGALLNDLKCGQQINNLYNVDSKGRRTKKNPEEQTWICIKKGECQSAMLPVDCGPSYSDGRKLDANAKICYELTPPGKKDAYFSETKYSAQITECTEAEARQVIATNPCGSPPPPVRPLIPDVPAARAKKKR